MSTVSRGDLKGKKGHWSQHWIRRSKLTEFAILRGFAASQFLVERGEKHLKLG